MTWKRRRAWWARIPNSHGRRVDRPLGTRGRPVLNGNTARAIGVWLANRARARDWRVLDLIADGRLSAADAYEAADQGTLAERIAQATDVDVAPLVADWLAILAKRPKPGAATRQKYARQVRAFIGASCPRSRFTRARVNVWLDGLDVAATNRYRAALSSFADWLVARDVLEHNVVRLVKARPEAPPRTAFLETADARRVLERLPARTAALHWLLAGTGLEVSAALGMCRRDLDLATWEVRARGSKTAHRNRTIRVTWQPAREVIARALGDLLPDAPLFPGVSAHMALRDLHAACQAAGVAVVRTHDWRHTYAVRELRAGMPLLLLAHQLGHGSTILAQRVYGRFVPQSQDYAAFDNRAHDRTATRPTNREGTNDA